MADRCVHCDRPIFWRAEFGDHCHVDGWVNCYGGGPRAMPRRDVPLEPVDTQIIKTRAGYFVSSLSTPGAFRLVSGANCTCPAHGQSCRHRKAVQELVRKENAEFARPVAPPAIGLLCD
jgi:hypothetical protein